MMVVVSGLFAGLWLSLPHSVCEAPAPGITEVLTGDLPKPQQHSYKVDPYIRAAGLLQEIGKERALKNLKTLAQNRDDESRTIVLCRMVFAAKPGIEFRRPSLGAAHFIGPNGFAREADYKTWPLEPIELIDGVPFLICRGYSLGGEPEPSSRYLAYCIDNCDWSKFRYKPKTMAEKKAALQSLLSLEKVKGKLDKYGIEFLESQIQ
jgi:hypothetical protein